MAESAAPTLTLLICDPVNEMHFVFVPPALLTAQNAVARVRDPLGLAPSLGVVLG